MPIKKQFRGLTTEQILAKLYKRKCGIVQSNVSLEPEELYQSSTPRLIMDNTKIELDSQTFYVLDEPLKAEQIRMQFNIYKFVEGVVLIDLHHLFDGLESLLDRLSEKLVGNDLLMDVDYTVIAAKSGTNELYIRVSGDPQMVIDMRD